MCLEEGDSEGERRLEEGRRTTSPAALLAQGDQLDSSPGGLHSRLRGGVWKVAAAGRPLEGPLLSFRQKKPQTESGLGSEPLRQDRNPG